MVSPPEWVQDAIVYQVFPDRFARSGRVPDPGRLEPWGDPPTLRGLKGGDLYGVVERLDHLASLGVNTLYLTPIFASPSNHRYHTHDYHAVDPVLGGDRAFEALLGACRERSMRVVLDAVLNHSGRSFLPFADVLQNGAESPYLDWFHVRRFPLHAFGGGRPGYDCWLGIPELPKLNVEHPPAREYLLDVLERWARRGIHGWRFDAPTQIASPSFWSEARARLRAIDEDLYLVGEIWTEAADWIAPRGPFDAVTNYWQGGAALVFATGGRFDFDRADNPEFPLMREALDAPGLGRVLAQVEASYAPETWRAHLTVIGSHDTARARTLALDAAGLRLATLLQFTLPGAPCVYYGDELGLEGGPDPACRAGMPWGEGDAEQLAWVRALARLRADTAALRRGDYRAIDTGARWVFGFERAHAGGRARVYANAGDAPFAVAPGGAEVALGELADGVLAPRAGVVLVEGGR